MTVGQLEMLGTNARLRFTCDLAHPIEAVWAAVTQKDQLLQWFPMAIDGEWAVGETLTFHSDLVDDFTGRVLAVEPPRLLEFTWGPDILRLEIQPAAHGCRLTLLDTFDEVGKGARDAAGWHICLDNLVAHLAGQPTRSHDDGWLALNQKYAAAFGPEASTVGPPQGFEPSS